MSFYKPGYIPAAPSTIPYRTAVRAKQFPTNRKFFFKTSRADLSLSRKNDRRRRSIYYTLRANRRAAISRRTRVAAATLSGGRKLSHRNGRDRLFCAQVFTFLLQPNRDACKLKTVTRSWRIFRLQASKIALVGGIYGSYSSGSGQCFQ
jgi:hypothetical protein